MTDPENVGEPQGEDEGIHVSDKRRFDPETYQRRGAGSGAADEAAPGGQAAGADQPRDTDQPQDTGKPQDGAPSEEDISVPDDASELAGDARVVELENQLNDRTNDLQRLQAEYVNYKRRVDRDRDLSRQGGIESVMRDMLEVLDDLQAARLHEELTGGFKAVADEVEKVAAKYGLVRFGEVGDAFDPRIHEALMQQEAPEGMEVEGPTCVTILQVGYRLGERVLRPARVAVAGS